MATMAYPAYDHFARQPSHMSRRQSINYGPAGQQVAFPYTEQPGVYNDSIGLHGETYPQPSYQIYAPPGNMSQHVPGTAYDDLAVRDSYFPDDRQISSGGAAYGLAHTASIPRRHSRSVSFSGHRRHSSVSFASRPHLENFRRPSSMNIKFKRKGAFRAGVTLGEAQANVRLSSNDAYTFHDLNVDNRGKILLKIRWSGYTSLTYEIPIDGYDGRISLQTLARRVARACVHFLQTNMIPIPWDRVELHHLEEISVGTWQPVLTAH